MPHNNIRILIKLFIVLALCIVLFSPDPSYAESPSSARNAQTWLNNCKSNFQPWQVTTIVVKCVESTMRVALSSYLNIFSELLRPTTMAVFVFSMIIMGIKIFSGLKEPNKEVMLFIVKFSMVLWFAFSLQDFAGVPFDTVHTLSTIAFGGYSPWNQMDLFFCKFFGTGCLPTMQLKNSIIAQMGPMLLSGSMGVLALIVGTLSMITSVYFMFRAIYTYLVSITLLAFLLILAPLFIPLALFSNTKRYIDKWINYIIAAVLHPVLLFAFLFIFLGTFTFMLDWFVDGLMGGNDFSQHWRSSKGAFSWVLTSDPATVQQLEGVIGESKNQSAVQSFVSPSMLSAVNVNPLSTYSLDFGANQVWAMQLFVFGFLGLFIVSYIMLSMINYLPDISDAIANVVIGMRVEGIPFVNEMRYMFSKAKGAMGK